MLPTTRVRLVALISIFRLLAALSFAALAFQNVPVLLKSTLYLAAMVSDLVDGYLARRLNAETHVGKVLDLVSDKCLTIVSLLYAAARGINLAPLALIAARELIMIGARLITIDSVQILPTSRLFGGVMALLLWGNTLLLISSDPPQSLIVSQAYWLCAVLFAVNLVIRIRTALTRIKPSSKLGQNSHIV